MEMYKWDPWWENDWPLSDLGKARPNQTTDAPVVIDENKTEYVIKARIPEFRKDEIVVTVDHGQMKIMAEHEEDKSTGYCGSFGVKPSHCSMCRSFSLPDEIDAAGIKATLEDGCLTLEIPRANGPNDREIKVAVH